MMCGHRRTAVRYGVAALASLTATAVCWMMVLQTNDEWPVTVYFVAILIAAWLGGLGPSVLALACGVAFSALFFGSPSGASLLASNNDWIELGLYLSTGTAMVILCELLNAAQRRAEAARFDAQMREEWYRTVADFTCDWEYWRGADGKMRYVSPSCRRITGYSADEFLADPGHIERIVHPDDKSAIAHHFQAEFCCEELQSMEYRIITREGQERWIEHLCQAIFDANGHFLGRRSNNRDITSRKRTEETIRRLATIVESSDDAILAKDLSGTILSWNTGALRIYGYAVEEAVGNSISIIVPPARSDEQRQLVERIGRGDRVAHFETVRRRKDGRQIHVSLTLSPLLDAQGRVVGASEIVRDITARKEAEKLHVKERERLISALDDLPAIVFMEAPNYTIPFANKRFRQIFGDPANRPCYEILHGRDRPCEPCLSFCNFPVRSPQISERNIAGGRTLMVYQDVISSENTGNVILTVGFDITASKQAEAALRASEAKYRRLYESMEDSYATVDMDGRFQEFNDAFCRMTGYDPEQLRTMRYADITPEKWRGIEGEIMEKQVLARGYSDIYEKEYRRQDGSLLAVELRTFLLRNDAGEPYGMGAIVRDITDRKRVAEEMALARAAAEAANVAKSQFLANMSHEIRTPMNAILGMTELALSEDLPPSVQDYLQTTKDSADALLELLDEVLDLSRIEAGHFELESVPCNPRHIVEKVVKILAQRASEKGLELRCEISPCMPEQLIGDPLRLRQVLMNLVGNAIKFTHEGHVAIRLEVESQQGDDVRLKFSVIDTGIGIAAEEQQRIFAPFTQADASTTRHYGGSGLGLAISNFLVGLMGGRLSVESQPGHGSTFFFTASLRAESNIALSDETSHLEGGPHRPLLHQDRTDMGHVSEVTPPKSATRSLRILLAEDTPANQKLVVRILSKRGHTVETASNGQEALDLLRQRNFDLVLMDVQMPLMDGFQATAAIRLWNNPKACIPVVAITAHALKGDQERCLAAGMDAYISKPINGGELVELVERMAVPSAA
jgi:PAS domain S-box-containing protein